MFRKVFALASLVAFTWVLAPVQANACHRRVKTVVVCCEPVYGSGCAGASSNSYPSYPSASAPYSAGYYNSGYPGGYGAGFGYYGGGYRDGNFGGRGFEGGRGGEGFNSREGGGYRR